MKRILPFLALVATAGLMAASASAQSLNYSNPYAITTLAGNKQAGASGYIDGTGTATRFNNPIGVAVDSSGNVYVADTTNDVVRKITSAGVVSTLAGQAGVQGELDGPGNQAKFTQIEAITVAPSGNVYVLDWTNLTTGAAVLRQISPSGVVTTLPGSGTPIAFVQPLAIASDTSGNLYVADTGENLIWKVNPSGSGSMTAFAGVKGQNNNVDGSANSAQFGYPTGISADSAGNVYVSDAQQDTIRKISGGNVTTIAGAAGNPGDVDGSAGASAFFHPYGVASDAAGNLFVTESSGLVREITTAGQVSTVAGQTTLHGNIDSSGQVASFSSPTGIAVGANDTIFVANTGYNTIRMGVAVGGSGAPVIATQPANETVQLGGIAMFQVAVSGSNLTYQWKFNGTALSDGSRVSGSQSSTLTVTNASASDQGNFTVVVTNSSGSVTSNAAVLAVTVPPSITTQPASTSVQTGSTATFSVAATGANLSYQWAFNGSPLSDGSGISGSNTAALAIANAATSNQGNYSVTVSNLYGSAVSSVVGLTVNATVVVKAHLINLSTLAQTTPSSPLSVGFSVGGSGSKSLLVRGIGPALAPFGTPTPLPNPQLGLYASGGNTLIASNTGWGTSTNPNPATLQAAFTQVQAFPIPSGSADSALLQTVAAGAVDSAQIVAASGTTSTGNVLAEIYDADMAANPSARLINLSSSATVVGNTAPLSAGFVIGGTGSETVLIRGIGPALAGFGLTGVLATPTLSIVNANASTPAISQSNTGWNSSLSATFTQVSAFPLTSGSADCAMVVTLPAGNYTATVSGVGGASGIALIEVYAVSSQ